MDTRPRTVEFNEDTAVGEANCCRIGDAVDFGRNVFEQLGIGVAHSNLEGRFTNVNPKFCDLLGYSRREALTLGIVDLTHPDDIGASIEARRRLLAGTVSHYEREARFIRKDGHELWTRIVTSLVRPANGAAMHFTSLVQDISRQKRLEKEQRETDLRFRQLAENIREVLFLRDPTDGRMLYISPAYEVIWGQSTSAVYANSSAWMEAIHPEDLAGVQRAVATANISGHMNHDYRIVRPDGTVRWINSRTFPVLDEKQKLFRLAGIAEDITERKRGEADIQQRIAQLKRAMYSTVDVIATMSSMRDPYTQGHQHRVAMMAAAIAEEMGLEPSRIEGVCIAGYLHDVGKIRVPAEILAKPTRLTPEEYDLIKLHPQAGYDILKRLEFPWPLAEIARQHHERLDGSGYPQGLKDQQILLEAKILAVADTVEAMASDRPYRMGRGLEAALAEIEAGRGKLFEPLAVDACLRLFRQKGYQLPTKSTPHDQPHLAESTGFWSRRFEVSRLTSSGTADSGEH
jgi:PAS domain S-box-containing protein/putative nucleotidyltransferase with HDIG domain